jgi:NAD(P)-dependent dehydrogenase (short-subunit alcohol dehydrogenase family)
MASRFVGMTFLVTGSSKGIGLATALVLAGEGARVLRVARGKSALEETRGLFTSSEVVDFALDATNPEAVRDWAGSIVSGKISGAAFCAGTHMIRPARLSAAAHYRSVFDANVISVTNFVPFLIKNAAEKASMVLVGSATVNRGAAAVSAYASAKSALIGLTRSLAAELAPSIRVNMVSPGVVQTEMTERFFKSLGEKNALSVLSHHPLGLGSPQDVARAIGFLLSPDSAWITGANLVVDGGYSINA